MSTKKVGATKGRRQKAHIPFRGDDLGRGKKTGKTINHVPRDADDFEPFEQVLDQAYRDNVLRALRTTRNALNGQHPRGQFSIPDDHDDYDSGERSMDIDSAPNSPSAYFNTASAPQTSSARRAGSSSRPVARRSNVDYDHVPSPRPAPRRSSIQSRVDSHLHNPSRLRNEIRNDDETARGVNAYADDDPFGAADYDEQELEYPGAGDDGLSHGNISFTELAQDDEEDSVAEDDQSLILTRTNKGKGRAEVSESDEGEDGEIEDDIAAGLQEVEEEPQYDDEEENNPGSSHKKRRPDDDRSRSPDPEPPKKPPKKSRPKQTQPRISMHETLNEDGLRRSKRHHYPPLEYWRQEKVVYGRPETGRSVVPVIKEIITIPKPPPQHLGGKKRKRGTTRPPRSKSKSKSSGPPAEELRIVEVDNPEQGWDDDTEMHGIVIDWNTGTDVERRVAFTSRMLKPKVAANSNYMFQKVFGDNDFIAAGQIMIPPGEQKPAKPAKDNTYVFYLIEGAVQFKVHRSSFIVATGGMFLVPRGNQYYIENICQRDAKLFFAQARKIPERDSDVAPSIRSMISALPRGRTARRSSSRNLLSPQQASTTKDGAQVPPEKT